jgi:putative transport protein
MLESAAEYLNANATLLFFSILALGYFVGKLGFGEFRLGAVAGVLFVGLFFGHFGFEMGPAAQTFGFSIFIFAVGYEAGPQFFEVMRTDGLRYLSLALVVVITGVLLTLMLTRAFDFQPGISAGLLGGALTTTPTLAAAQEALRTGNAIPPDGFPVQQAIDNAGAAYAITYLFGVIGLILLLKLLPRLLKIDLPAQAAALKVSETNAGQQAKNMVPRTYRVLRDGYSVHEVEDYAGRLRVMQVRRSDEALEFELTTRLEIGDEILVLGTPGAFVSLPADRFTETADVANFDTKLESVAVIIEKPALVGKSLSEISARRGPAGVFILGIQRMRVELPLESDIVLQKGDVVRFLGNEAVVKRAASMVGHVERDVDETDLLSVAIGRYPGWIADRQHCRCLDWPGIGGRPACSGARNRIPVRERPQVRSHPRCCAVAAQGTRVADVHDRRGNQRWRTSRGDAALGRPAPRPVWNNADGHTRRRRLRVWQEGAWFEPGAPARRNCRLNDQWRSPQSRPGYR